MIKNNIMKIIKKFGLILLAFYIISILNIPAYSLNSGIDYSDESKITITNIEQQTNQPEGFGRDFNLLPISMDVIDQLSSINHILDVVPIVNYIYYNLSLNPHGNFSPDDFNRTMPPDGFPDNFNRTMPPDGFNGTRPSDIFPDDFSSENKFQEATDYIVEGILLNSDFVSDYLIKNFNLKEGDNLDKNDSYEVIIGLDAAEYFKTGFGGNITINGMNLIVKGIIENIEFSKYIFMNITDAQTIYGLNQDEVNTLYVYVDDSSYLEDVSSEISNQFQNFRSSYIGQQTNYPFDVNQEDKQYNEDNLGDDTPGFELILILSAMIFFICYFKKNHYKVKKNEK